MLRETHVLPIARHRAALHRHQLSRPIQLAINDSLILPHCTVLDYGCGQGDDIRRLLNREIRAYGWDPFYHPHGTLAPADVVNLGYVVNVIEDLSERAKVLNSAWGYTTRLLIVSARLITASDIESTLSYGDGYLTQLGTFQKLFDQSELRQWIDATLGESSVAAAPGVFYVFRDKDLKKLEPTGNCRSFSFKDLRFAHLYWLSP